MSDTGGFICDINLTDFCEKYLIQNISQIIMPHGINIIPITWDTNKVDEYFEVIKSYIIELLEEIQKSKLKDLKYYNNNNTIRLDVNNKEVNMKFDYAIFNSDILMEIINTYGEVIGEETNSKTTHTPIEKLPLFILLIDTDKPHDGVLCKLNDIRNILGIVHEMVINRFTPLKI
tara:strand:- start:550 stop:1074 length:525 start_codon:yes stop_codon:yes gene_type:complete